MVHRFVTIFVRYLDNGEEGEWKIAGSDSTSYLIKTPRGPITVAGKYETAKKTALDSNGAEEVFPLARIDALCGRASEDNPELELEGISRSPEEAFLFAHGPALYYILKPYGRSGYILEPDEVQIADFDRRYDEPGNQRKLSPTEIEALRIYRRK